MVSPYPSQQVATMLPSGVAGYTARLASALTDEGLRVRVLAPAVEGEPSLTRVDGVTVERSYRRGVTALPAAATAAGRSAAPVVHLQFETFLYGGPLSIPGVAPALAALRGRQQGPVVTMHQVVDPGSVNRDFTRVHRVRVPHQVARAGLSTIQRTVLALSAATVVHERAFERIMPSSVVVPHGIDVGGAVNPDEVRAAKESLGLNPDRLTALCFGFLSPYKGLEVALEGAALAGEAVELVVAGGSHPRLNGRDPYASDLQRHYGHVARFSGYVTEPAVPTFFRAADVLLLPYLVPFASSGPFALALGFGTPVLCSPALARCLGASPAMSVPMEPESVAERLIELAANPLRLREVSAATQQLAGGRTWPDVARRHVALYEEVIDASGTAGRRVRPGKPG